VLHQAKISMLRLRQERSLSSLGRRSLTRTVCLGVTEPRGTVLILPLLCSCALVFLSLVVRVLLVSSYYVVRQCTLRCPGVGHSFLIAIHNQKELSFAL
jgi:membrane protein required for beta-lactamase induction